MHCAIQLNSTELAEYIIQKIRKDELRTLCNQQEKFGNSPLHYAVQVMNEEAVELLLKTSIIDTALRNQDQDTAFMLAIKRGYSRISGKIIRA